MKKMWQCGLMVLVVMVAAVSARAADEVTDWNEAAFRAALVAAASPLNSGRVAAMVQTAVFDAVNGVDRRYTPIHVAPPPSCAGASRRAAAVQAAYVILSKVYGATATAANQQPTLDARLTASLAAIKARDNPASIAKGLACGQDVANAIWTWRSADADGFNTPQPPFFGKNVPGEWRSTPTDPYPGTSLPMAGRQYVAMTPWAIESPFQFRPASPGPPDLNGVQYARDFNETKTMGSRTSAFRTADQTNAAWFWATGTAPLLWNQVALSLIEARSGDRDDDGERGGRWQRESGRDRDEQNRLLENARILATLNISMADAAIGCWDAKWEYRFWRPITAIREADPANPRIASDPGWTPLFATPAHQDYPSGHSCVSGAATTVLADEFGERTRFSVTSDLILGVSRSFRSFSDALEEVKNARIFAGIHFRTACDDGTKIGLAVGRYVLDHNFQRLR